MKTKKFSILISILCSAVIFAVIVPYEYAMLSLDQFTQSSDLTVKSLIITVASLLLVFVCLAIMHGLLKSGNAFFDCCAILLITDPLLKCSMLDLKYICLLIATVLLCFYFSRSKSPVLKTVLMAVFAFASVMIYKDAAFCHVPVASLVYGFTLMPAENAADNLGEDSKKSAVLPTAAIIPSIALPFVLAVVLKTIFADKLFSLNMIFRFVNANTLFYKGRLLFAVIPSICLLVMFIHKYFRTKREGEKSTLNIKLKKAKLLLPILLPLVPILLGIFVFDSYPAAAVTNMFFIIAILAFYHYDPQPASKAACDILAMFRKHKFIWCTLFFLWLVAVSALFKDSSTSILDNISTLSGGKL